MSYCRQTIGGIERSRRSTKAIVCRKAELVRREVVCQLSLDHIWECLSDMLYVNNRVRYSTVTGKLPWFLHRRCLSSSEIVAIEKKHVSRHRSNQGKFISRYPVFNVDIFQPSFSVSVSFVTNTHWLQWRVCLLLQSRYRSLPCARSSSAVSSCCTMPTASECSRITYRKNSREIKLQRVK